MLSAYKYRIYPNAQQEMRLKRSLLSLCNLYDRLRARKEEAHMPKLWSEASKRPQLCKADQEAWHPLNGKKPALGRRVVTRRAEAPAIPEGNGKSRC